LSHPPRLQIEAGRGGGRLGRVARRCGQSRRPTHSIQHGLDDCFSGLGVVCTRLSKRFLNGQQTIHFSVLLDLRDLAGLRDQEIR
jgi:hypothetical protein